LAARNKKGVLFHAPLFMVRPMIPVISKVMPKLITEDQFTMLLEGSATKEDSIAEIGGFERTPFRKAIRIALKTTPPATYAKAKK
jgi:hypothetical protein